METQRGYPMHSTIESAPTHKVAPADMWTFPEAALSRRDLVKATLVEIGIAMQDMKGTDQAAEYLKSQGIALDIAVRVLSRPLQRRK